MDIKGKIHEIGSVLQVTDTVKKRELIIEYAENPQYPEYLKFEAINDKCSIMDTLKVGQDVEVYFNLRGRPWTDKTGKKTYFNSMNVWKVAVLSVGSTPEYAAPVDINCAPDDDDLPF